jgi:hypothetical protein
MCNALQYFTLLGNTSSILHTKMDSYERLLCRRTSGTQQQHDRHYCREILDSIHRTRLLVSGASTFPRTTTGFGGTLPHGAPSAPPPSQWPLRRWPATRMRQPSARQPEWKNTSPNLRARVLSEIQRHQASSQFRRVRISLLPRARRVRELRGSLPARR